MSSAQPTLFDQIEIIDSCYTAFTGRGVIFWRRMGLKYGADADWSTRFTPEKMKRVNDKSAQCLHELGGLGSVW